MTTVYSHSLSNEVLSSLANKGLKPLVCTSPGMEVLYSCLLTELPTKTMNTYTQQKYDKHQQR